VASGKSRREVADAKLGISEATLHRIETGKTPVTAANVRPCAGCTASTRA
jgi:DNA-binding Xre family transcriptional regulator